MTAERLYRATLCSASRARVTHPEPDGYRYRWKLIAMIGTRRGQVGDESIQYLEEADRAGSHLIDLLNQADQSLLQFKISLGSFREAHQLNNTPAAEIEQAITDVEQAIQHAVAKHNEVIAKLNEAKAAVAARPADDPGY